MITTFYAAVIFTILASALCSLLEAMVLSTNPTDVENFKVRHPRAGKLIEEMRGQLEETSSAILSLNTIANTAGATVAGVLFAQVYQTDDTFLFPLAMTFTILVFSEIIPKNVGVLYRSTLFPYMVYPLVGIRFIMWPISRLASIGVRMITGGRKAEAETSDEDILLLAKKSHEEGEISRDEHDMINNALNLDTVLVAEIMTPRTVVTAVDESLTVGEAFSELKNIPFARMPTYRDSIDTITGYVRRRDLLAALANDEHSHLVADLRKEVLIIPDNATASDALQNFLKAHQQIAVTVDEFGSVAGVVTMEDIVEAILGREIFEDDDIAVDMREFAKQQHQENQLRQRPFPAE